MLRSTKKNAEKFICLSIYSHDHDLLIYDIHHYTLIPSIQTHLTKSLVLIDWLGNISNIYSKPYSLYCCSTFFWHIEWINEIGFVAWYHNQIKLCVFYFTQIGKRKTRKRKSRSTDTNVNFFNQLSEHFLPKNDMIARKRETSCLLWSDTSSTHETNERMNEWMELICIYDSSEFTYSCFFCMFAVCCINWVTSNFVCAFNKYSSYIRFWIVRVARNFCLFQVQIFMIMTNLDIHPKKQKSIPFVRRKAGKSWQSSK